MDAAVYVATSLDGFVARRNGSLDWLTNVDPGEGDYGFGGFLASVDALVMGRTTFDFVLATGEWPYGDTPVIVMTHRALPLPADFTGRVETSDATPHELAVALAERGVTSVYVDGAVTLQDFMRAGLVQRIIITRLPVLIGSGIPLFGSLDADVDLRLIRADAYPNGWTQTEYEVIRPQAVP